MCLQQFSKYIREHGCANEQKKKQAPVTEVATDSKPATQHPQYVNDPGGGRTEKGAGNSAKEKKCMDTSVASCRPETTVWPFFTSHGGLTCRRCQIV